MTAAVPRPTAADSSDATVLSDDSAAALDLETISTQPVDDRVLRSLERLEAPPGARLEVEDLGITDGPAIVDAAYRFTPGEQLQTKTFLLYQKRNIDHVPAWVSLGTQVAQVESVDPNTGITTVLVRQVSPGKAISVGGSSTVRVPEQRIACLPNGTIRNLNTTTDIQVDDRTVSITVPESAGAPGRLVLPDRDLRIGEKWETFRSEDDSFVSFTFKGYALVNGRKCMKIAEESSVTNRATLADHRSATYEIEAHAEVSGFHYFDYERGCSAGKDLLFRTSVTSDMEMPDDVQYQQDPYRMLSIVTSEPSQVRKGDQL
jgi:hypothetical protein